MSDIAERLSRRHPLLFRYAFGSPIGPYDADGWEPLLTAACDRLERILERSLASDGANAFYVVLVVRTNESLLLFDLRGPRDEEVSDIVRELRRATAVTCPTCGR